jgi:PRC-barrel domain
MTLPSVETARNWSRLTAVDSDDQPLGRITDIYLDHDTGQPEWALVATPQRRRTFVPLAGAVRKGDRIVVAVPKAAVSDAPAIRSGRELSDGDAARLYGHYVGTPGDRSRGARRARGRRPAARLRSAAAPPARSASSQLREARGGVSQAGRLGRLRWLSLAGLGSALLVVVAVLAGRSGAAGHRASGRRCAGRWESCWLPSRLRCRVVAVAGGWGRSAGLAAAAAAGGVRLGGVRPAAAGRRAEPSRRAAPPRQAQADGAHGSTADCLGKGTAW